MNPNSFTHLPKPTPQGPTPGPPPRILTKEELGKMYNALEKMKAEGKEHDPAYQKGIRMFRYHYHFFKLNQLQQQQPQGMLRPPQQYSMQQPNMMQQQQQYVPQNYVQVQGYPMMMQPQQMSRPMLTPQQQVQLRVQIYIYRDHLREKRAIPECLIAALRGQNVDHNLKEYERIKAYQKQQQQIPHHHQQQYVPQYQMIPQNPQGFIPQQQPHQMRFQAPNELDLLITERDRRIDSRIKKRYEELKQILIGHNYTEEEKKKAAFSIKLFQMRHIQKKVRRDILLDHNKNEEAKLVKSRTVAKRIPGGPGRKRKDESVPFEGNITPQRRFVIDVLNHRKKFLKYHDNNKKTAEKLVKDIHSQMERKQKLAREKKEREEKARLKALKENDSEGYYKLLVSAKNERLLQLLEQTDDCLKTLGAHLVQERGTDEVKSEMTETSSEKGGIVEKFLENEKSYYSVAHKVVEKIDKQPSLLKGGALKTYQIEGLQWLVSLYNNKLNGILADEMGLGKTIQTISLITFLMEYKNNKGPFLVIVPLSTVENWKSEFARWAPHIKLIHYGGSPQRRKDLQTKELKHPEMFEVLVTQYEFITKDKKVLKKINWNYIIMDEGHRIKNKDCILVRDLKQYKSAHRLLLTGTPLQNDLKELWALLNFLLPNIFDSSSNFETWFNSPFASMGLDKSTEKDIAMTEEETLLIIHRLHQVLRPFLLRREKKDVETQLPEKVEKVIKCPMSALQKLMYTQLRDTNRLVGAQGKARQKNLNNSIMQLRKVCNHPFLFFQDDWSQFSEGDIVRASGKFELLDIILPKLYKTGHKVLIFSQMTHLLDILEAYLKWRGYIFLRLDGNVKAESRGQLVKDFNANKDLFLFLLSTRAGGLGLNLQTSDTVIIFDSDWNPQQDLQAMARAHRIGQTRAVRVFVLCTSGTVEEKIFERAQEKRDAEAKVIQAGRFDQKSTVKERQEMLENIMTVKTVEDLQDDIPTPEQLNQILARSDQEFEIFQKMDQEDVNRYKLMEEKDIPQWILDSQQQVEDPMEELLGRGFRNKNLFFEVKEEKEDEVLGVLKEEEAEEDDVQEDDEEVVIEKKRKRKEPVKTSKKKKKYELTDVDKKMLAVLKVLQSMKNETQDIAGIFEYLPSKELYPDYYQYIRTPICYNQIQTKIQKGQYKNFDAFEADVKQVVVNAQFYNQEGSEIHNASIAVWNTFCKEKERAFGRFVQDEEEEEDEVEFVEKEEEDEEEEGFVEDDKSDIGSVSDEGSNVASDQEGAKSQDGFGLSVPAWAPEQQDNEFMSFW